MTGNSATQLTTSGDRAIVITRTFDAPRDVVFKLMTDPTLIPKWWGPRGYTTIVDQMEVKPGGVWRYIHRLPNGEETAFHGVYQEVAPPARLAYTFVWEGMPDQEVLETVTFEEADGKTYVTDTALYPSADVRAVVIQSGMAQGAQETMDRLAELLVTA